MTFDGLNHRTGFEYDAAGITHYTSENRTGAYSFAAGIDRDVETQGFRFSASWSYYWHLGSLSGPVSR